MTWAALGRKPVEEEPEPCEACGHLPGDPIPAGRVLKLAREAAGLTMIALLESIDSPRETSWLAQLETRKRVPYSEEWEALCGAVGLDPVKAAKGER